MHLLFRPERFFFLLLCVLTILPVSGQISLPRLISNGVVLQREQATKLWGWASPGESIRISIAGERLKTRTGADGKWSVSLPAQPAGGPFTMELSGKNKLIVEDVMFGDVWLCSGQSNMETPGSRVKAQYPEEFVEADYPSIREFTVARGTDLNGPQDQLPGGEWLAVTPETILDMSAVAHFFARSLHETYDVPIGIIRSAWGGTPIEAWTSAEGLSEFPDIAATVARNQDTAYINTITAPRTPGGNPGPPPVTDQGLLEEWFSPDYAPRGWQTINLPGYWEDQGIRDLDGTVWYRREIDLPQAWAGQELRLTMGRIVDADVVYVNGEQVGNTTYLYPPRNYTIPAGVTKAGKNLIVVRVMNYGGKGGFVPDKPYVISDGRDSVDLQGNWTFKVGEVYPRVRRGGGGPSFAEQNAPTALYNAMIAPLLPYTIKGFTWYQGESNAGHPEDYYELLPALIRDWRSAFGQGDLPFLTVQLANYMDRSYQPAESNWAELRDAQFQSLALPNTGLAVISDVGEWNDIHPLNKMAVGERLARSARHIAYGETELTYSGPQYQSAEITGDSIRVRFAQVGEGLRTNDGLSPQYFAIAGYDRRYVWAEARIEEDGVVVWNEKVADPQFVRYAWADNPVGANLTNETGIPASPFQTDSTVLSRHQRWRGKEATVVLTYDDAIVQHLDNALPVLDSLNLKATFYLTGNSPGAREHIEAWRRAARNGHELGNHTLYHPCDASLPGREWVGPDNDLSKMSTESLLQEIDLTNAFLEAIDGETERTFAYTCGDTATADGSFKDELRERFVAARGTVGELEQPATADLYNLRCYVVNGQTSEELIEWVEKARRENAMITILFHGVEGGNALNVTNRDHREFLEYLYRNQGDLWVTTMLEGAEHLKSRKQLK